MVQICPTYIDVDPENILTGDLIILSQEDINVLANGHSIKLTNSKNKNYSLLIVFGENVDEGFDKLNNNGCYEVKYSDKATN